jgi:hypothetical protein
LENDPGALSNDHTRSSDARADLAEDDALESRLMALLSERMLDMGH